jgi:hypothetical protein
MAQEIQRILIKYEADIKELRKDLDNTKKELRGVEKESSRSSKAIVNSFKAVGGAILAAFSVQVVKSFAIESAKLADQQLKAEAQLLTSLKGRKDAQQELIKQAAELQKVTTFGDEETILAQSRIAAFVTETEQIKELTRVSQDFAAARGVDLATAADLITKSFASSTNALVRYGIEIEGAAGSNERLESAVDALDAAFKGQAQTLAQTGLGPLQQLQNAFGDLQEQIGAIIINGLPGLTSGVSSFISNISAALDRFISRNKKASEELLKANRESFLSGKRLADEYERLADKTDLNATESQRLKDIVFELKAEFGESVVQINKETNSLAINRAELIKQVQARAALQSESAQALLAERAAAELAVAQGELAVERYNELRQASEPWLANLAEEGASTLQNADAIATLTGAQKARFEELTRLRNEALSGDFGAARLKEIDEELGRLGVNIESLLLDPSGPFLQGFGGADESVDGVAESVGGLAEDLEMLAEIVAFKEQWEEQIAQPIELGALRAKRALADLEQSIIENGEIRNQQIAQSSEQYNVFADDIAQANQDIALGVASAFSSTLQGIANATGDSAELAKAFLVFNKLIAVADVVINLNREIAAISANPALTAAPDLGASVKVPAIAAAKARAGVSIATILATAIPELAFAEGTSDAPGGVAWVGEEGPEIMHVPKGARVFTADASKRERSLIDAINEGRASAFIEETYVTPALSGFAENIAKSAPWQAYDDFFLRQDVKGLKRGIELGPRTMRKLSGYQTKRYH